MTDGKTTTIEQREIFRAFHCALDDYSTYEYYCPSGEHYTYTCQGRAYDFNATCRNSSYVECAIWHPVHRTWDWSSCTVQETLATNITCACSNFSAYLSTNTGGMVSLDVSAVNMYYTDNLITQPLVFGLRRRLTVVSISILVVIGFSMIIACLLIWYCNALRLDYNDMRRIKPIGGQGTAVRKRRVINEEALQGTLRSHRSRRKVVEDWGDSSDSEEEVRVRRPRHLVGSRKVHPAPMTTTRTTTMETYGIRTGKIFSEDPRVRELLEESLPWFVKACTPYDRLKKAIATWHPLLGACATTTTGIESRRLRLIRLSSHTVVCLVMYH